MARYRLSRADKVTARAELQRLANAESELKKWFFAIDAGDPNYKKAQQEYTSQFTKIFLRVNLFERFLRGGEDISEACEKKLEENIAEACRTLENPIVSQRERRGSVFVRDFCTFRLHSIRAIREVLAKSR